MNNHEQTKLSKNIIWKNIIVIACFTIIFGILGILYARHKRHTTYEAERTIMTSTSYQGANANEEVQADISLGKTYAKITESKNVAKRAHRELPKNMRKEYTVKDISSMVNADPVAQTTLIKVSVKSSSAKRAAKIVNAVTDAAAKEIPRRVPSAKQVSLFSKASKSDTTSKTSPSTKKMALLGAAVGLLLGMVVSFSITTWKHLI
ncbi:Wzz/FepE/Etk N-terminal domain-containing protein [uncultured Limosilactobacillus sp.]|uniref:YveK family protein n=1 Tax=uncultured Limosilactobacillus sp. TaxID=2837629 RepID=UPI0025F6DE38|nr:Wzz/FepE/Etk N-terminal domain-containing protein [uncultured Limosilactobacillus sp.]